MPFILRSLLLVIPHTVDLRPMIFLSLVSITTPIIFLTPSKKSANITSCLNPMTINISSFFVSVSIMSIFILFLVFSTIIGIISLFNFEKSTLANSAYFCPKVENFMGKDTFFPSNVMFLDISSETLNKRLYSFSTFHCTLPSGVLLAYLPVADCLPFLSISFSAIFEL